MGEGYGDAKCKAFAERELFRVPMGRYKSAFVGYVSSPMERGHGGNEVSPAHLKLVKTWVEAEVFWCGGVSKVKADAGSSRWNKDDTAIGKTNASLINT